jgi:hypothetical protein
LLRALGCTTAQGYLFAPPLEPIDLESLLTGPARGVGAARLRPPDGELAADDPPEPMPEPPLAVTPQAESSGSAEEPAARGVGAARLRLLPDPSEPVADAEPAAEPAPASGADQGSQPPVTRA